MNAAQKALSLAAENRGVKLSAAKAKEMLSRLTSILTGSSEDEAMKLCAICYENVEESNAIILSKCGHVFCDTCLTKWSEESENKNCPM